MSNFSCQVSDKWMKTRTIKPSSGQGTDRTWVLS